MDTNDYLQLFIEETKQHLQAIREGLSALQQQTPVDLKAVDAIFRSAHTLKGMAGAMQFDHMVHMTHELESCLDELRSGRLQVSDAVINVLSDMHATLQDQFQRIIDTGTDAGTEIDSSLAGSRDMTKSQIASAASAPSATNSAAIIRMLPIETVFNRFSSMVRHLAASLGKDVDLVWSGGDSLIDRALSEAIFHPLLHLVRNAVDHGLEPPQERLSAGKSTTGTIRLSAQIQDGTLWIDIRDDGRGINRQRVVGKAIERGVIGPSEAELLTDSAVFDLLFHPGLSTAEQVTTISGRGVGLDAVRHSIHALHGLVTVESQPGQGSAFVISLPLDGKSMG